MLIESCPKREIWWGRIWIYPLILLSLILTACSTKWMDDLIRDDYRRLEIIHRYARAPKGTLPGLEKTQCLNADILDPKQIVALLNKRATQFKFRVCNRAPLVLRALTSNKESSVGVNSGKFKLKKFADVTGKGNNLLVTLLLGSMSSTQKYVRVDEIIEYQTPFNKGRLVVKTENFLVSRIRSKDNPDGEIDLEEIVLEEIVQKISANLKVSFQRKIFQKHFADIEDIDPDFKWNLHHEAYHLALVRLDELIKNNPRLARLWYNRGLIQEYYGRYEKSQSEYSEAMALDPKYKADLERLKTYMDHLATHPHLF